MRCESSNFWQEILNVPDSRSWYECRCPEHMLLEEIFLNGIGKPHNVCYPGDHWAIQREGWTPKNQRKINLRFHGWAVLFVQYNKNKCFLILKKVKTKNVTMSKFKNNISHYYLLQCEFEHASKEIASIWKLHCIGHNWKVWVHCAFSCDSANCQKKCKHNCIGRSGVVSLLNDSSSCEVSTHLF